MKPIARTKRALVAAAAGLCLLFIVILKFGPYIEAENPRPTAMPPIVGATKSATLVAGNGDADADPGDTIEYTITVNNAAAPAAGNDATNVQIMDTLQNIQTFVGGSLQVAPIAVNDSYSAIGNVNISVPDGALDLLANDINPGGAGSLVIVAPLPTTSANGGNVSINATTGAFTYNPAPGFSGSDTFTYTLGNGSGLTDTATVTIAVSTPVWFVNSAAAGGGDGRLTTPFNCFVGTNCFDDTTLDEAGDFIFLYSGAYTGGQTLLANQRILGAGATVTLASFIGVTPQSYSATLPATGGARPTMTTVAAATSAITLGSGNTLRGFNIGNTTAVDITGTNFGTFTALEMDLNGTGRPLNLTTGTLAATFDTLTSTSAASGVGINLIGVAGSLTVSATTSISLAGAQGINMSGSSVVANFGTSTTITDPVTQGILIGTQTANVTFGNTTVSDATDGISLQNNSAGTRSFGTLMVTNGTGDSFVHAVGGGTTTVSGLATLTNPSGNCIDIQDSTTAISFQNVNCTQSGSTGVYLDDNTGGVTFADLDINPDAGQRGLEADPGNTGTITTTSGTIVTTTGIAIDIEGTSSASRTPLNMQLTSVASNGAASGIILTNTSSNGSPGGFRVLGTGSANSGGSILNSTGPGVNLTTVANVHFTNFNVQNGGDDGIRGSNVTDFSLTGCSISGNGNAVTERGVEVTNLLGTVTITGSTVTSNAEDNLYVMNGTGTLNFSTTSSTYSNTSASVGNDGIHFIGANVGGSNNANMTISVTNCTFTNNRGDHFQATTDAASSATQSIIFQNNDLNNSVGTNLGAGITINPSGSANVAFNISNIGTVADPFTGAFVSAITINSSGNSTMSGRINNNVIGNPAVTDSGSFSGDGITVFANATSDITIAITNNTIREYSNLAGINIHARDNFGNPTDSFIQATLTGNTISDPGTFASHGIFAQAGAVAGDNHFLCVDVGGAGALANTIGGSGANGATDFRVRQRINTTVRLPGYVGANGDTAAVVAFIQGRNNGVETGSATTQNVPGTGGGFVGGAACTQPALAEVREQASQLSQWNLDVSNPLRTALLPPLQMLNGSSSLSRTYKSELTSEAASSLVIRDLDPSGRGPETYWEKLAVIFTEVCDRVGGSFSGTAYAQEKSASPEGVDVNVGPFTLPAGEAITVKFRATVNNGPFGSGVNAATNTANVTADGGVNVNSNTTSIALDAAPDLVVTKTEGGGTTQPGSTLVYTLSYSNTTAVNGQDAANVVLTETVPANTTFNAMASLPSVWSCADGSAAGTNCTINIGSLAANANGTATFAVNVLAALPAGTTQVSNSSSIAENPNVNGTDRVPANNTGADTTNIIGVWDGSAGGGGFANWNNNLNWSNDVLPTGNVSIPNVANQPFINTPVTAGSITLNGENVDIDAAGTITATGNVSLGTNIVTGLGLLELGPASAITRTTGQVQCTLRKNFAGPGPVFEMPLGTAGAFSPLNVTVVAGAGQLTARANTGMPVVAPIPLDATRTLQRYWTLSGSGIRSNLTFNYLDGDVPGPPNNENIWNIIRVTGNTAVRYQPTLPYVMMDPANNRFTITDLETYSDWTAGEPLAPTAANVNVSGRVVDLSGRGISRTQLVMQDQNGNTILAITNPFGYYSFDNVPAGQSYLITPRHKEYSFLPRTIAVNDDMTDVDFIGEP